MNYASIIRHKYDIILYNRHSVKPAESMRQPKANPSSLAALPADLAALLLEADRDIRRLEPENPYRLYEFLHATTRCFLPVDAFYICLYSEADQSLCFAYNAEGEIYDAPATVPLGDGPTSRVIKQGRPVVWHNEAEARIAGGIMFGQMERFTCSAIHVPIHATPKSPGQNPSVIGVVSAQAYPPDSYTAQSVQAMQWLANRAGMALLRDREEAAWRTRLNAATADAADRQRPLLAMAGEFVTILQTLTRQAEESLRLLPPGCDPALTHALTVLCQECYAAQTEASQLPLRHDLCPNPSHVSVLSQLTPTESIVLKHLAAGKSNKAIAAELCVGVEAVKFHCRHIFQKLDVPNRTAAARLWLECNPDRPL